MGKYQWAGKRMSKFWIAFFESELPGFLGRISCQNVRNFKKAFKMLCREIFYHTFLSSCNVTYREFSFW